MQWIYYTFNKSLVAWHVYWYYPFNAYASCMRPMRPQHRHRITFGLNCSNRVFSCQRARALTHNIPQLQYILLGLDILQNREPINYRLTRNSFNRFLPESDPNNFKRDWWMAYTNWILKIEKEKKKKMNMNVKHVRPGRIFHMISLCKLWWFEFFFFLLFLCFDVFLLCTYFARMNEMWWWLWSYFATGFFIGSTIGAGSISSSINCIF